jgi:hypothetical protein
MQDMTSAASVRKGRAMEWFLIEARVALSVAVAIVWWTITPAKKKKP